MTHWSDRKKKNSEVRVINNRGIQKWMSLDELLKSWVSFDCDDGLHWWTNDGA